MRAAWRQTVRHNSSFFFFFFSSTSSAFLPFLGFPLPTTLNAVQLNARTNCTCTVAHTLLLLLLLLLLLSFLLLLLLVTYPSSLRSVYLCCTPIQSAAVGKKRKDHWNARNEKRHAECNNMTSLPVEHSTQQQLQPIQSSASRVRPCPVFVWR